MSIELPSITDIEALLAAERALPVAVDELRANVWARLCKTFGWGAPTGGAGGAGIRALFSVALAAGIAGGGYLLAGGGNATPAPHGGNPGDRGGHARAVPPSERDALAAFGEPGRPDRVIAGRVVFGETPVDGARVVLTDFATRAGFAEQVTIVTGADGAFDFGERIAGGHDVTATAPGKGYDSVHVALEDPTRRADDLVLRLSGCDHRLEGVVRDASGGVVAGAQILPTRGGWNTGTEIGSGAVSGADGGYELCVRAGAIAVVVRAAGYGAITISDSVYRRRRLDIVLVPEGTVTGRVVRADDGSPVARAQIWLNPAEFPEHIRTASAQAVTASDGTFRMTGIAPGRHMIWAETRALAVAAAVPVVVDAGTDAGEVLLRLEARGIVRGRVVDERGAPVPGAEVALDVEGRRQGEPIAAGADGEFEVWGVDVGDPLVDLTFEVIDHDVISPKTYTRPASPGARVTVTVAGLASIRGRVERHGAAVPYAEVGLLGRALPGSPRRVYAAYDGTFALTGLPPGRYSLGATSDATQAFTSGDSPAIELKAGEARGGVVVELDSAASITGQVVDQNGQPAVDVFVQYTHQQTGDLCRAITADDGRFYCGMMTGHGTYAPIVRPDRDSEVSFSGAETDGLAPVELGDSEAAVTGQILRVRMLHSTITGRVVRGSGEPYPDVTVTALEASAGDPPATTFWWTRARSVSDADGRFSIGVWNDGSYSIYARAPGGGDATVPDVTAGAGDVVLRIGDLGALRGTIIGFVRPPDVVVQRIGEPDEQLRPRRDSDSFALDRLAAGRYVVMATAGAQGAAEAVEVRSGTVVSVALRPRPTGSVAGRVVDFVTGSPVAGISCVAAPYQPGAELYGWRGAQATAPSDADGRFSIDAASGEIEITCLHQQGHSSSGAAQILAEAGTTTDAAVKVVLGGPPDSSLGARVSDHVVVQLRPGGAAKLAGLRVGDRITAIDGRDVAVLTDDGFDRLVGSMPLATITKLTFARAGRSSTVSIAVEAPWWR